MRSNIDTHTSLGLSQTETKADRALYGLEHLRLQRRFVLDLKQGTNFAFNSAALTDETRRAIDGFLSDLKEAQDTVFLVAGHTETPDPKTTTTSWDRKGRLAWQGTLSLTKGSILCG